jgi:hypothetical protein
MPAGLSQGPKPYQGYPRSIVIAYRAPELLVLQLVAARLHRPKKLLISRRLAPPQGDHPQR